MLFMLYSIFLRCFCLLFELHFLIHLAPLMHHHSPLFVSSFLSLLPLDSFVYLWQKGGEDFMTHVHILRGRYSTSCTFVGGEIHRGDAYIKGEKTFFYEKISFMRKPCFTLCLFSRCFMVLYGLCFIALIASYLCVELAYILILVLMIIYFAMWSL